MNEIKTKDNQKVCTMYRERKTKRRRERQEEEREAGGETDRRRRERQEEEERETIKKMGSLYLENDSLLFDKTKG